MFIACPSLRLADLRYLSPYQVECLRTARVLVQCRQQLDLLNLTHGDTDSLQAQQQHLREQLALLMYGAGADIEELMRLDEERAISRALEKQIGPSVGPLTDRGLEKLGFRKVDPKPPPETTQKG